MTDGGIFTDGVLSRIEHKLLNLRTTLGRMSVCVVFATMVLLNSRCLELSLNETRILIRPPAKNTRDDARLVLTSRKRLP
jgi:hypothetical protein